MSIHDLENVSITKEEAKAALRSHAWTTDEHDCDLEEGGFVAPRIVIHSRMGGMGADHDLSHALELVDRADEIVWTTSLLRHELAVAVDGRVYCYDVPRPERKAV